MNIQTVHWVLIGIGILLLLAILSYLVLRYIYHKPTGSIWLYLFMIFMFWTWIFTIYETPSKRREKLKKAGVKEGQVILDLGCGIGRFTLLAARIVGTAGRVYALDIHLYIRQLLESGLKWKKRKILALFLPTVAIQDYQIEL